MNLTVRHLGIILLFIVILIGVNPLCVQGQNTISDSSLYYTSLIVKANQQATLLPNKAYQKLQNSYLYFKHKKDTTKMVECLLGMSVIQQQRGKFSLTFDHLWEAQYLTKLTTNKDQKADVHIRLARLYDSFNMDKESLFQLEEALQVSKDIYFENEQDIEHLIASYMNLAVRQRKSGNYVTALNYLDSCFINNWVVENKSVEMPFWDAERGYIMLNMGNYSESKRLLHSALTNVEGQNVSYTPNINMYLGELNMALTQPDSAIYYFIKSLNLIRNDKLSNELEAEVLHKLSEVYFSRGDAGIAFDYLAQSKLVADSILKLKNQTNSELFEIKNTYLQSISQKNEQLERQNIVLEQNRQIQLRLKIILTLGVLLGIVLYVVIRMRLKLRRTLLDKKETELKSKITEERNKAEIEAKSKELTSYALQLIDKDSAIDELLKVIQKESPSTYKSQCNKHKKGSQDLWDDFNLRFTEVNSAFYSRLTSKHPDLSITEQKHCALIKLNFATKEMARILNIETHSVHMSRSRIRKKIGLQRSDSLEKYIADL